MAGDIRMPIGNVHQPVMPAATQPQTPSLSEQKPGGDSGPERKPRGKAKAKAKSPATPQVAGQEPGTPVVRTKKELTAKEKAVARASTLGTAIADAKLWPHVLKSQQNL